jgi:hypothetical protein
MRVVITDHSPIDKFVNEPVDDRECTRVLPVSKAITILPLDQAHAMLMITAVAFSALLSHPMILVALK